MSVISKINVEASLFVGDQCLWISLDTLYYKFMSSWTCYKVMFCLTLIMKQTSYQQLLYQFHRILVFQEHWSCTNESVSSIMTYTCILENFYEDFKEKMYLKLFVIDIICYNVFCFTMYWILYLEYPVPRRLFLFYREGPRGGHTETAEWKGVYSASQCQVPTPGPTGCKLCTSRLVFWVIRGLPFALTFSHEIALACKCMLQLTAFYPLSALHPVCLWLSPPCMFLLT